ncbi:MAG: TolC family protein [Tannerellaceae bacterium]
MKYWDSYKIYRLLLCSLLLPASLHVAAQQAVRQLPVEELFRLGIENSLQLKAAKIQEVITDDQQKTALSQRLPNLQVGASAGLIGQPIVFQKGLSRPMRPDVPNWSQNYNIELSQPLYQGGKIRYNIRKADLQKQIASISSTNDQAEVKLLLLQQYVSLFSYYKQRDVLDRNIEESERRLKDIRRMRKEGVLTRNDEIRSELQLTNDRLAQQEADNSIAIASQQLDILLGLNESLLIMPDTTLLYTNLLLQDYESYVQLAYESYPGMQIARHNTQLAENDTRLTKADNLPALSLHAGNTLARPMSNTLADMYNNNWNIALNLSYNLSSLYQNKHRIHEAKQMVQLRRNAEEMLMQDVCIQIRSAYIRHKEALNRVEALKLSVKQAEENYRIVQNRYLNQLSILTDLLDASNVRLDAELQLTTARSQTIYTYYELQRACGNL